MTVGRPLEYDPEIAIDAAMKLFWRQGYESTSLQDLLTEMGLSKSSFYQAYASKHNLFELCIERYRSLTITLFNKQLNQNPSARGFLDTLFFRVAKETRDARTRHGCLLMNTASEFGQTDLTIAQLVGDGLEQIGFVFETAIKQGQKAGEISNNKDASQLANFLVSTISGLKNMVKAGKDEQTIKHIAETALSVLD